MFRTKYRHSVMRTHSYISGKLNLLASNNRQTNVLRNWRINTIDAKKTKKKTHENIQKKTTKYIFANTITLIQKKEQNGRSTYIFSMIFGYGIDKQPL